MNEFSLLSFCGIISLVIGLLGFYRTVWFISVGYTLSIAAFCVLSAIVCGTASFVSRLQTTLLFVWAIRLGYFIIQRERNDHYRAAVVDQTSKAESLPVLVKVQIWLAVSILYVCMFAPVAITAVHYEMTAAHTRTNKIMAYVGLEIMLLGLVLEAAADRQKSQFKKRHPHSFARTGLYSWVRYPNYLGEILVWLGSFVVGLTVYTRFWHWSTATLGLLCIILIMCGSTKRMEGKQDARYGKSEAFQTWIRTTPVLFPWVPLYTLQNTRVYLE